MNCIKPSFRRAFTAVELAVVIAGLSISAMLLPALGKAKAKANRLKCAYNLSTINKSFQGLSIDTDGSTPWLSGAFAPGDTRSERLAQDLGLKEVRDVYNVETIWRFYTLRQSLGGLSSLCSPSDPAAAANLKQHRVKTFDEYRERSDFIVPRQIQSYALHMGGDVTAPGTIMATTRNFDGDDAVPTKKPGANNIVPNLGRSLRSKNLKHAHFIGADEASHSRVMGGLNASQGNIVTSDGAVRQATDADLHQAIRRHSNSWAEGSHGIALDENLSRPRQ